MDLINLTAYKYYLHLHEFFFLKFSQGITKTYNLTFQECETLQAIFSKDLSLNFITAQAK